jgi:hypothetical protein
LPASPNSIAIVPFKKFLAQDAEQGLEQGLEIARDRNDDRAALAGGSTGRTKYLPEKDGRRIPVPEKRRPLSGYLQSRFDLGKG